MTRIPLLLGSSVLVLASVLADCRAGDTSEQPGASAAPPRPEEPIAGPPDEEVATVTPEFTTQNDEVACTLPNETAPAAPAIKVAPTHAVAKRTTSSKRAVEAAIASEVRRDDKTSLDEAIRRELESAPPQNATASEPVGMVTTTGATIPRAPAASASSALETVAFVNRMPASYDLRRVRLTIDGSLVYDGSAILSVQVPRGDHFVEVVADYGVRGSIFSSREDVHLEARSTYMLHAADGASSVAITAVEHGGITLPLEKRVAIEWREAR